MNRPEVVLAFSGGLDTSFCVPYLREKGYDVVTLFVDSGGTDPAEMRYIEERARSLGVVDHLVADAGEALWREVVVPLVRGGALYQDQYPLLCSDRYVIVRRSLELCKARGTKLFAHGCTGMGNDQVRFDCTAHALGDFTVIAPIRDIQAQHKAVRAYEQAYLEERGFAVRAKTSRYSINANLLGVTTSGGEIDQFGAPGDETYTLTRPSSDWPREPARVVLGFARGAAVTLDGEAVAGPLLLARLNTLFGAYGVGRGIYTGDTTIGLKGRIVFECPGLTALLVAHRALEQAILTHPQNSFKPLAAQKWVELVYKGLFYEPLKYDIEALLESSQRFVAGTVTLETSGGICHAVAIDSPHILKNAHAVYAQSADWGAAQAEGFIQLFGQSTTLSSRVNPIEKL
ncbi:MAG: argininosuccinate synthase [Myxococcales bacterium]|nr:argininosuccinate synthase [Myxococcales bacterium]